MRRLPLLLAVWLVTACATAPVAPGRSAPPRVDRDRLGVVLIDAQPAFWRSMHGDPEPVMQRIEELLVLAGVARLPLVATFEHSPEWNGWLPERLEEVFPEHGVRLVKRTFDCCREPEIREAVLAMGVDQVALAGAETDVCVLQSALGLLELGLEVFLVVDAVFSNEANVRPALERMLAAGVVPVTYKTLFFEVDESVDPASWPAEWRARMEAGARRPRSPYRLAPASAP